MSLRRAIRTRTAQVVGRCRMWEGRTRSAQILSRHLEPGSKLHLGCGPVRVPGWVNIDIDRTLKPDLRLDLRFGLPGHSNTVSLIYSEHLFEHLSLDSGTRLMRDCCRILVPGGILRIAMPDLEALVRHYQGEWKSQSWLQDPAYEAIDSPAHMLNYAMREWGHLYLYDRDELHRRLREAGFLYVRDAVWGHSAHSGLRGLETREESNLIVEATAP